MKKRLFYILPACILLVSATLNAGASVSAAEKIKTEKGTIFSEEIVSSFINELTAPDADTYESPNYFTRRYASKIRENLEKIVDGFVMKYMSDHVSTTNYYDQKAQWTGSIKRYYEKQLPDEVRNLVKRKFCTYRITSVEEVETTESEGAPTYIVHVENDTNIKLLKVNNGELQVWKDILKNTY